MLPNLRTLRITKTSIAALFWALFHVCIDAPQANGQTTAPTLGAPQAVAEVQAGPRKESPYVDELLSNDSVLPIDLVTAMRLAGTNNLDISRAREIVVQSRIQLQRAYLLMLPNVGMGSTYFKHEGKIQRTEGNIVTVNRDSLFVGLGPSMSMNFADAIFAPLVARQGNNASQ